MTSRKFGDRAGPWGRLRLMLGAALLALASASSGRAAPASTTLYSFTGGGDGAWPYAGSLIFDDAFNLYGTTTVGGVGGCGLSGCGTVFKVAPNGTETVLYSFTAGSDGGHPFAGLIFDAVGNLYGTTFEGGVRLRCGTGCGTVFKLAPDGTFTVLYSFAGGSDGANPIAGLIFDAAGNLYGTTFQGGVSGCGGSGCGTVFKLAPDGTFTVLYSFAGGSDGANPSAGLIFDAAGNLYGTTEAGGGGCGGSGCGTVFKLAPDGTFTVLYSFAGGSDGANPFAGLIFDAAGNLYGTTTVGGVGSCGVSGCGTVFRLAPNPDGTYSETVLYSFAGGSDGVYPLGGLIFDTAGVLYGTTQGGGGVGCGGGGCGTVFQLTTTRETVLYSFAGGSDGENPLAGLILDVLGNLYGTTQFGGGFVCGGGGCGTVFKLLGGAPGGAPPARPDSVAPSRGASLSP